MIVNKLLGMHHFLYRSLTEAGQSFGEIALMTKEAIRNASIIADDETDLLVIDKELFDGTLKVSTQDTSLYIYCFHHEWNSRHWKVWQISFIPLSG